jgi:D-alanyl-lipoteichoic acid acyltransferase DltB (MBOAT superfamily)
MLFHSLDFLAFLLVVLVLYHVLIRDWSRRKLMLLGASWLFYATWSPRFLLLLIASTAADFQLARWIYARRWEAPGIERPEGRARARSLLVASLVLNLGVLAWFKYGLFLYGSVGEILALPPAPRILAVAVPLGVSFYTFHAISYIVDTYRGIRPPTSSFTDYALYVAFFPQLVAGPITRWGFFGPQLVERLHVGWHRIDGSLFLLAVGFVKKVACADSLGAFVDEVYAHPEAFSQLEHWIVLYAYAFQIYFDFSGYTDIAMGVAGLLGFRLPENFRHPYLAENPSEFWRRWHVSLSTWLRDYLYVGLGGNRQGRVRTYVNLFLTMLLGGLWHGAAWTFVAWGAFHGLWLALHRAIVRDAVLGRGVAELPIPRWLRRVATFHLVALAWVPFRATSFSDAGVVLHGLVAGPDRLNAPLPLGVVAIVLIGLATHGLALQSNLEHVFGRLPRPARGIAYGAVIVLIALTIGQSERFIYFQF